MRTKILVVAVVIALAITASVVIAQGPRGDKPGMGMGKGMGGGCGLGIGMGLGPQIMKDLNLTPDQIQQFQKMHADFMASAQGTRDQLKMKMQEVAQLWAQDASAAQLKSKFAEIDGIKADLRDAGIDFALQARSMLTEQQRAKIRQMMKDKPGFCAGMGCGLGMCCGMGCPGMGPGGKGMGTGACPIGKGAPRCPK